MCGVCRAVCGVQMTVTSKKPDDVRRQELLEEVAEPLEEMVLVNTPRLMQSHSGGDVLVETYNALSAESIADAVAEAVGDNLAFTLGETTEGDAAAGRFNVLDNAASHRVLRALLGARPTGRGTGGSDADARPDAAVAFAGKMYEVMKGQLGAAATSGNRGAFTIAHLVSALPAEQRAAAVVSHACTSLRRPHAVHSRARALTPVLT